MENLKKFMYEDILYEKDGIAAKLSLVTTRNFKHRIC